MLPQHRAVRIRRNPPSSGSIVRPKYLTAESKQGQVEIVRSLQIVENEAGSTPGTVLEDEEGNEVSPILEDILSPPERQELIEAISGMRALIGLPHSRGIVFLGTISQGSWDIDRIERAFCAVSGMVRRSENDESSRIRLVAIPFCRRVEGIESISRMIDLRVALALLGATCANLKIRASRSLPKTVEEDEDRLERLNAYNS